MNITICIGSSCHIHGSRTIIETLQQKISERKLDDQIELSGTFCMGKCQKNGVCVTVDGNFHSINPESLDDFFENAVLTKLN